MKIHCIHDESENNLGIFSNNNWNIIKQSIPQKEMLNYSWYNKAEFSHTHKMQ